MVTIIDYNYSDTIFMQGAVATIKGNRRGQSQEIKLF
jgi:hypothetical protein